MISVVVLHFNVVIVKFLKGVRESSPFIVLGEGQLLESKEIRIHLQENVEMNTYLTNVVDPHLAIISAHHDLLSVRRPYASIERCSLIDGHGHRGQLSVQVQIPNIEHALAIDGGEHRGMDWRPSNVVDVVAAIFERIQWLRLFHAPQLKGPIETGR